MTAEIDYSAELSNLGWYRAETIAVVKDALEEVGEYDRDARYYAADDGSAAGFWAYLDVDPLIADAKDMYDLSDFESRLHANLHVRCMVRLLGKDTYYFVFFPPEAKEWYEEMLRELPGDTDLLRQRTHLHLELWTEVGSPEEMWAVMVAKEGWPPPKEVIEEAVWFHATGRDDTTNLLRRR